MSGNNTKAEDDEDMLPEYDLTGGVRGKYAERYRQGTNVVVLDPDVAKIFTSSEAVMLGASERLSVKELQGRKMLAQTLRTDLALLEPLDPRAHLRLIGARRLPTELREKTDTFDVRLLRLQGVAGELQILHHSVS